MTGERIAGIAAFAVVLAGVAIGFATIGPPQHTRLMELDRHRVTDLQSIAARLGPNPYANPAGFTPKLPPRPSEAWPRDPVTHRPYEYRRETATRYRLCAVFILPADVDDGADRWRHAAGRTCYRLDATEPGRP